ncbi:Rho-type gtpase-activating protein [Coemansia thaxteri]|nr:Rho-type gtpase-activating protein [Coemansia thaxteri]KAJ2473305.1 Rho-type gtpase-activating protein [Coemansia sp. RSA 2322]
MTESVGGPDSEALLAGSGGSSDPGVLSAPPKCWGCQKAIDGGSAIQFADGVWHIECKVIEFDSNLLFLADGKPICPECSYCCSLCKKPIFDEAIVTVEGTYHSECFRCTNCKQRIQGKSFAKTSQGVIYCVTCYGERRERKKAAKRRRELQLGEEKMLPSLPAEAGSASAENTVSPSSAASSPHADEALGPRQQAGQPPQDLRSRRRGIHTSSEFGAAADAADLTLTQAIELADADAGADAAAPLARQQRVHGSAAASAPTSPTRGSSAQAAALRHAHAHAQLAAPAAPPSPLQVTLSADPLLDLRLAWTEDMGALESNYVRFSMRTSLAPARPPELPALARVASGSRSPGMQRARAASNASALSSLVPPGLRSSANAVDAGSSSQHSLTRPSALAAASDGDSEGGKEWLGAASVDELKEELLHNYGQLCRMEASYQKLRDLYASVIDQLLEARDALQQERARRVDCEAALADHVQLAAKSAAPSSSAAQRGRSASGVPPRGHAPATARQPSLRRQRQARKTDAPGAAEHANDSGSDADDAIITTVPQKATKRFIWPFGGSSSRHHAEEGHANGADAMPPPPLLPQAGGAKLSVDAAAGGAPRHSFHVTSTFRAGKCDHCQERLKTFTSSVVRCRACGFVCHQRCMPEVTAGCLPPENAAAAAAAAAASSAAAHTTHTAQASLSNGQAGDGPPPLVYDPSVPFVADRMFGRALSEQTALEGHAVPWVVRAAIAFIEHEGLTMEGVYRRSGSTMDIRAVQVEITRVAAATANRFTGAPPIASADTDVTSVTSVLKQYFRDLPNPLMTSDTYHLWVQAANIGSPEERIRVYRTISDSMPAPHSETLRYLMRHLKRVAENQLENKMNSNNLSVVFAPNILHMAKNDVLLEMANMSGINKTVSFLIQHAEEIWGDAHYETYSESASAPGGVATAAAVVAPRPPMRRLKELNMLTVNAMDGSAGGAAPAAGSTVDALCGALENTMLSHSMPSPKGLHFAHSDGAAATSVAPPDRLASAYHLRNANNNPTAAAAAAAAAVVRQKTSLDIPRSKQQ